MTSRFLRFISIKAGVIALPLLLVACGGDKDANNLAELDARLTNDMSDPALRGALEGPLATDPDLAGQSNARAVRAGEKPLSGAVPVLPANAKAAAAQALKVAGGRLESTPAPTKGEACAECAANRPATLGAMARDRGTGGKGCGAMQYGAGWAERLPAAFPIYPGARLMEAAGNEGQCKLRGVSFVSAVPMQGVMDFYYTIARRNGYDAEHQLLDGQHVLGGTRAKDDGAYFITFDNAPGGGTTVDIVANNGR
ncbi:hypothetical protein KFK14_02475 [Sphingobium phenoxybenzoativorans]|uniref:Lipoprotein n=1 Tax=Sphingobium phenoxybenzoativorans TaxID=1592790 RepID=A0A975K7S7_9SPHN|nr:hypothetical protein [Sphingobium phenoxybenzoativorans]QUT06366.1 hypothetical protein KFK14_02475 [Sphingobium phenoxybenzoativorans]